MQDRDVVVRDGSGGSVATFGIIAVIVVAALIALFLWQPWNANSTTHNSTTIVTPANPGAGAGAGGNTSGGGSSSTTTTNGSK